MKRGEMVQFQPALPTQSSSEIGAEWNSVPVGLEILTPCRIITMRQQEDDVEYIGNAHMSGFDRRNTYDVFDQADQRIFHVSEMTDLKEKQQGQRRKYVISCFDYTGSEVLTIKRVPKCCGDGIECFLANGDQIGSITGPCNIICLSTYYSVHGDMQNPKESQLLIEDRGWCSREFAVLLGEDKTRAMAYITKRLTSKEGIHDADVYVIEFKGSNELHPVYKALLLGSVFFLDFKYFEETRGRELEVDKQNNRKSKASVHSKVSTRVPSPTVIISDNDENKE